MSTESNPTNQGPTFLSLSDGQAHLAKVLDETFAQIRCAANTYLPPQDVSGVILKNDGDQLIDEFKGFAEYCLVVAARHIFQDPRIRLKTPVAKRIQEPFRIYEVDRMYTGILDFEKVRSPKSMKLMDEIRTDYESNVVQNDSSGVMLHYRRFQPLIMNTLQHCCARYPAPDPKADPRTWFLIVSGMFKTITFLEPETLNTTTCTNDQGVQRRCAATGRALQPGDPALFFQISYERVIKPTPSATGVASNPLVYQECSEGVLDHTSLERRQWESSKDNQQGQKEGNPPPRLATGKKSPVSAVARRLLRFGRADYYVALKIIKVAEKCLSAHEAIVSHKVLEKQRDARKSLVPKKNKPDLLEGNILAWYDFAQSSKGIEWIVKLFNELKFYQLHFVKSWWQLQTVLPLPQPRAPASTAESNAGATPEPMQVDG